MNEDFRSDTDRIVAGLDRVIEALEKIEGALADLEKAAESPSVNLDALGYALFHLKERYDAADRLVKRIYHVKDAIDKRVLPERMRANNIDGFKLPEIARSFSIIEKTSASFVDKEAGMKWLRSIGQGDIIQETVNASTLAAFCRSMLIEQGVEPPPEAIKVSTYSTTGMTKYRPKG